MTYARDLRGYGPRPPHPRWPNGARIALQFVLNHEEGAENCVLDGDPASETGEQAADIELAAADPDLEEPRLVELVVQRRLRPPVAGGVARPARISGIGQ